MQKHDFNKQQKEAILDLFNNPKSNASQERGLHHRVANKDGKLTGRANDYVTDLIGTRAALNTLQARGFKGHEVDRLRGQVAALQP